VVDALLAHQHQSHALKSSFPSSEVPEDPVAAVYCGMLLTLALPSKTEQAEYSPLRCHSRIGVFVLYYRGIICLVICM
jgi:hypothetical protein